MLPDWGSPIINRGQEADFKVLKDSMSQTADNTEVEAAKQAADEVADLEVEAAGSRSAHEAGGTRIWDVILVLGIIGLLPLLYLHAMDLWATIELRFFPVLPAVALLLAIVCGRRGSCGTRVRAIAAIVLLVLSATAAGYGAWKLQPWFGLVALIMLWMSWMLVRLGPSPWYRCAAWLLPLVALASFPTSPTYDATRTLEAQVLTSGSGVLDLIGIAHLPADSGIGTENARVPIEKVTRGVSNPYLLLSLSLLLVMFTQRSFLIGLLTLLTVPLWSWLASATFLTAGLYALETKGVILFTEQRHLLIQSGLLVLSLLFIWLSSIAFKNLLAPFPGYSTTSNAVHKFYNWLVYWPESDPLSRRREDSDKAWKKVSAGFWGSKTVRICMLLAACGLLAAGGYAGYQILPA